MQLKEYYKYYINGLSDYLSPLTVPTILNDLIKFNLSINGDYSPDFGLSTDDDYVDVILDANDVEEDDIERIITKVIPFASINAGMYAFWLYDGCSSADEAPILFIGHDPGCMVFEASNIKEFLHLVSTGIFSYTDQLEGYLDKDMIEKLVLYRKWLKDTLGLDEITSDKEVEDIKNKAKAKYQDLFNRFLTENNAEIMIEEDEEDN